MRRLVLFDIDGTLLLTAGAGRRAIVAALSAEVGRSDAFNHGQSLSTPNPPGAEDARPASILALTPEASR